MNSTGTQPVLRCPKCHGDLVVYERQGIVVDQCRDCRGIWLDRGEIEHLIDVEAEYVRRMSKPDGASRPDSYDPRRDDPRRDDPRRDDPRRDDPRRDDPRDSRYPDGDDDRRRRGGDRRGNLFGDIFGDIIGG